MLVKREQRFNDNLNFVMDAEGFEMPMPESIDAYPAHIKEVLKYLQTTISAKDIVSLQMGETNDEALINVYYKILEKVNIVLMKSNEFMKLSSHMTPERIQTSTLAT